MEAYDTRETYNFRRFCKTSGTINKFSVDGSAIVTFEKHD